MFFGKMYKIGLPVVWATTLEWRDTGRFELRLWDRKGYSLQIDSSAVRIGSHSHNGCLLVGIGGCRDVNPNSRFEMLATVVKSIVNRLKVGKSAEENTLLKFTTISYTVAPVISVNASVSSVKFNSRKKSFGQNSPAKFGRQIKLKPVPFQVRCG